MKKKRFQQYLSALLAVLTAGALLLPASAADKTTTDIDWKIDPSAMKDVSDNGGSSEFSLTPGDTVLTDFDGNKCLSFSHSNFLILDEGNLLFKPDTFHVSYELYFEQFPTGTRKDGSTPDEYPIAIFTWIANGSYDRSVRVDSRGNLYKTRDPASAIGAKIDAGKWHSLDFAVSPSSGNFTLTLDGTPVYTGSYPALTKASSSKLRFFDTAYEYSAYVRNIRVFSENGSEIDAPSPFETADFLGCQTTAVKDGKFGIRVLASLPSLNYPSVGFRILAFVTKDGKTAEYEYNASASSVFESVNADGKSVSAASLGAKYLAVFPCDGLDADADIRLIVRPFAKKNRLKVYGKYTVLDYSGNTADGYPTLSISSGKTEDITLPASGDTYTQVSSSTPNGSKTMLEMKQNGATKSTTRYIYIRFDIPDEFVPVIRSGKRIELQINLDSARNLTAEETAAGGLPVAVYTTGADWSEDTLVFSSAAKSAPDKKKLGIMRVIGAGYQGFDVTDTLLEALDAGERSVSFRLENISSDGSNSPSRYYSREYEDGLAAPRLAPASEGLCHELTLRTAKNEGIEPWGYAESLVDEWFGSLRDEVYACGADDVLELEKTDITKKQGTHTVLVEGSSTSNPPTPKWKTQYARTVDTLISAGGYVEGGVALTEYDDYGGIANAGFTGKATGFFHVETVDGRPYIIDPLGNPFFVCSLKSVNMGSTTNQKNAALKKFGSAEAFWREITATLTSVGVNLSTDSTDNIIVGETPMNAIVRLSGISGYMKSLGLSNSLGGSASFLYGDAMNAFDPDYVSYFLKTNAEKLQKYASSDRILGYISDNELPAKITLFDTYLTLDPTIPENAFNYAVAWTFLDASTDAINPSLADVTDEMREDFKTFLYDRLMSVARAAIDRYDPNHLYLGTCAHGDNRNSESYLRAAGHNCDIITVNMYDGMEPSVETFAAIYRYSGKPFIVSEFYAKAQDALDMNGQLLANQQNAGWLVKTQADRAAYYENYTLILLECRYCVGWSWYRFQDNDQSLYHPSETDSSKILRVWERAEGYDVASFIDEDGNILPATGKEVKFYAGEKDVSGLGSNKGLVDNNMALYETLGDSFSRISRNLMGLVKYFDALHD